MARNILVPIDFSDVAETVLAEAIDLARAFEAKIWLIHVAAPEAAFVGYEFGLLPSRDRVANEVRREHQMLQHHQDSLRAAGLDATAMLVAGSGAEKILEEAQRVEADMIVLGCHGHGALSHLLTGSVCEGVLRHATCPVVIVPRAATIATDDPTHTEADQPTPTGGPSPAAPPG